MTRTVEASDPARPTSRKQQVGAGVRTFATRKSVRWFGPLLTVGKIDFPLPDHFSRVLPVFALGTVGLLPAGSGMVLLGLSAHQTDATTSAAARFGIEALVRQRLSLLFLGVSAFSVVITVVATAALRRALIAHGRKYPASSCCSTAPT